MCGKGNGIKHQEENAAAPALKARPGAGCAAATAGHAPPALQSAHHRGVHGNLEVMAVG